MTLVVEMYSIIKCVLVCYVLERTLCQQKTGGVLTLPRVFLLLTPLPVGPCRAPTVCTMILKGVGVGRGWSQVSLTLALYKNGADESGLGTRLAMSLVTTMEYYVNYYTLYTNGVMVYLC